MKIAIASLLMVFLALCTYGQAVDLTGTVTHGISGAPLKDVVVQLKKNNGFSDTTGSDGAYQITNVAVKPGKSSNSIKSSRISGNFLEFSITNASVVNADVFSAAGIKIATILQNKKMASGTYRFSLADAGLPSNLYFIRYRDGKETMVHKYFSLHHGQRQCASKSPLSNTVSLSKTISATIDTLVFTRSGFSSAQVAVTEYTGQYNAVLKPSSIPAIVFVGPDTVVIAKDDPSHVLSVLKVTATDSIWGDLTDSIKLTGNVFTSVCSTFTVVYSVRNPLGFQSQRSRTIIVDCVPPDIVLKGENPLRLVMGTPYMEPGADATDNIDGTLTSKIILTGTIHSDREGLDTLTYSVTDKAGNVGSQKRLVIVYAVVVSDTVPPVLTLKGANPLTLMVNGVYIEPGYVAIDLPNHDTITNKVVVTGLPVITWAPGRDTLTYTVKDNANNIATQKRIIIIQPVNTGKDTTPPVITFLVCSVCTTKVGQTWVEPGYTAFDDHDGDLTSRVIPPSQKPNTSVPGVTMLRYTVTDSAGNSATYIRTVMVVGTSTDTTRPIITLDGAVRCTVSVGKTFTEPGYSAQDNVDGVITDKVIRTLKNSAGAASNLTTFTNTIDKYTIAYTVSDASGNAAVPMIRNVVVKDTVIDTTGRSLLIKYGVPLANPLPALNKIYSTIATEGTGPTLANWSQLWLNWDLGLNNLYIFAFNTTDGVPGYYVDITSKVTRNFNQAAPAFTLTGSGIAGLDGAYYINANATQCVWVKKDGSYAVIFK